MAGAPTIHGFGTSGQASATQLFEVLSSYNPQMMLEWVPEAKHFKLRGYSHMADDEISRIITKRQYIGWAPRITRRTTDGSIIVELTAADADPYLRMLTSYSNMPTSSFAPTLDLRGLSSAISVKQPGPRQAVTNASFKKNSVEAADKASSSAKLPEKLDYEDVLAIHNVKEQILARTCESDLLLFLGNTGSYFYYAFNDHDNRNAHLIPISGRVYIDQETIPTENQLRSFYSNILLPAIERRQFNRVVLVDHSHTGQSIDSFNSILRAICSFLHPKSLTQILSSPVFLNIVDIRQRDGWITAPQTVPTIALL